MLLVCLLAFSAPGFSRETQEKGSSKESAGQSETEPQNIDLFRENPIDRAFAKSFAQADATPVINFVNEQYLDAWKAELENVSGLVKKSFTHPEDGTRVDAYLADYRSLGKKAFDLEMLNWISDPKESIASRSFGTGAAGGAMLAEATIYKQAALNLITHYQANPDLKYVFAYKGSGPNLESLRKQE